jgi:AcrR family transcriptional regulator
MKPETEQLTPDADSRGAAMPDADNNGTATRDRIIRTAVALFAQNGYDATGIAELIAAAGVSRGSFYYHIDSKQTLLFLISKNQVDTMNAVAAPIATSTDSAADKVRALARSLIRNIADHQAEWAVFFRDFFALKGARRQEILAARDRYEQYWLEVLQEGTRRGEFISVTPLLVKGVLGMLNYTYLWIDPNGQVSPEELADSYTDLLLKGLLRTPGAS